MSYTLSKRAADTFRAIAREKDTAVAPRGFRGRKAVYFTATMLPGRTGAEGVSAASVSGNLTEYKSGQVTLEKDTGDELEATGETVVAYNRMQDDVPGDTAVWLAWWSGKFWIVGYEC